jgi:hypothetical protein
VSAEELCAFEYSDLSWHTQQVALRLLSSRDLYAHEDQCSYNLRGLYRQQVSQCHHHRHIYLLPQGLLVCIEASSSEARMILRPQLSRIEGQLSRILGDWAWFALWQTLAGAELLA